MVYQDYINDPLDGLQEDHARVTMDIQELDRDSDWAYEWFNMWLDDEGEIDIRGRVYKPSELLQGLPYEYKSLYESFKRQKMDELQSEQAVIETQMREDLPWDY